MVAQDAQRFKLLSPIDLDALPEPTWLIEGVLPTNAFCVLYGEPGCGKTFVALSMALSIAGAQNWCGKPTKNACSVLYVAAEGLYGLKLRVLAYQRKHAIRAEKIRYLGVGFNLLDHCDIEAVLQSLNSANFKPDLIILDTLARLMIGADENSAKEMGLAIGAIDELRRETSGTVLLVHHTGKTGRSERGSSALRGAADVMIECSCGEDSGLVSLKCDKMKDTEPFSPAKLGLERIALSPSSSSLAITDWRDAFEAAADSGRAMQAVEVLRRTFGSNGATNTEWLAAYKSISGQSKSTFDRAIRALKKCGAVRYDGGKYYTNGANGGVSVNQVSGACHDTGHDGVRSPPTLGGDTDTVATR